MGNKSNASLKWIAILLAVSIGLLLIKPYHRNRVSPVLPEQKLSEEEIREILFPYDSIDLADSIYSICKIFHILRPKKDIDSIISYLAKGITYPGEDDYWEFMALRRHLDTYNDTLTY